MRTGRQLSLCTLAPFVSSAILPRGVDVARSLLTTLPSQQDQDQPRRLVARTTSITTSNNTYLPAQIGGIVGAYALCLVIVAITLLALAKKRREHLEGGEEFEFYKQQALANQQIPLPETIQLQDTTIPYNLKSPLHANFTHPAPLPPPPPPPATNTSPVSYNSSFRAPGVDPFVDPGVVSADREMAQAQLEQMYKYVMEHDEAKARGVTLAEPPSPLSPESGSGSGQNPFGVYGNNSNNNHNHKQQTSVSSGSLFRKEKSKPKSLNLSLGSSSSTKDKEERTSRTASILSALKSPRGSKKKVQGLSISSPIMTPMSGTFPRGAGGDGGEEMNPISPRFYAPAAPPPVPGMSQQAYQQQQGGYPQQQQFKVHALQPKQSMQSFQSFQPITPDISPQSTLSIDERIGNTLGSANNNNNHQPDPVSAVSAASAVSADSSAPLVGLPSSPKPGVTRFPSLPASPRATSFSRPNAPSAVRTGGALPLRAYEPSVTSPSYATHSQTKQTVFERAQPLSPSGAQTPWTGTAVPYSPYQPFSPVIPITPSLVTKADRKRMKRYEPKTPTVEMVKSTDETW